MEGGGVTFPAMGAGAFSPALGGAILSVFNCFDLRGNCCCDVLRHFLCKSWKGFRHALRSSAFWRVLPLLATKKNLKITNPVVTSCKHFTKISAPEFAWFLEISQGWQMIFWEWRALANVKGCHLWPLQLRPRRVIQHLKVCPFSGHTLCFVRRIRGVRYHQIGLI